MHADNWAQKAKEKGYRSRAVFKLEEILKNTKIKNNSNVIDLVCSPG
jgi:23S rRNA U2552 (ribose-2'-O)-methylase RlmE/FtsJ